MNASDEALDDEPPIDQPDSSRTSRSGGSASRPNARINLAHESPLRLGSLAILIGAYAAIGDVDGTRRSALTTLARVEKAIGQDQNNGPAISTGAYALTALGEAERAEEWIARALLVDPDNLAMRFNFACGVNAHLKDADRALDLLGPLFATISSGFLTEFMADPDLDPIRANPRFMAMLAAAEARLAGGLR